MTVRGGNGARATENERENAVSTEAEAFPVAPLNKPRRLFTAALLSYIRNTLAPCLFQRDAINGNKFQTHPPLRAVIQTLAIPPHCRHSLPTLAYLKKTVPLAQRVGGGEPDGVHPELLDIPQKPAVGALQHNCVLKRRLYETPDVRAQTHNPQTPNKKYKICTLFDDDLMASETFFCL